MDRPDEGRAERNPSTCRELTLPFDSTFRYFDARARSRAPFPSDFIVKVMHLIDRSLSPSPSLSFSLACEIFRNGPLRSAIHLYPRAIRNNGYSDPWRITRVRVRVRVRREGGRKLF